MHLPFEALILIYLPRLTRLAPLRSDQSDGSAPGGCASALHHMSKVQFLIDGAVSLKITTLRHERLRRLLCVIFVFWCFRAAWVQRSAGCCEGWRAEIMLPLLRGRKGEIQARAYSNITEEEIWSQINDWFRAAGRARGARRDRRCTWQIEIAAPNKLKVYL